MTTKTPEYIKTAAKMNAQSSQKYIQFMKNHLFDKSSNLEITNTRIGNNAEIWGGSYHIPESEYSDFLNLYYNNCILNKKKEYLTEKQLEGAAPILVDIDLRYKYEEESRHYTYENITDLIDGYLEEFKSIFQFEENSNFKVIVFEKPHVNRIEAKNYTKDGIHIIITLNTDRTTQLILRKKMINFVKQVWENVPIINTWDDVFDEGISIGHTNWQLFGSCKPDHETYMPTYIFDITYDISDDEFINKPVDLSTYDYKTNIELFSVRNKKNINPMLKNSFIQEHKTEYNKVDLRPSRAAMKANHRIANGQPSSHAMDVLKITNADELAAGLQEYYDNLKPEDYQLKDAYNYTFILPPEFYESGSYDKWIRTGMALRNTSDCLFIVWVGFSAKARTFDYRSIPELYEKWIKFDMDNPLGLTKRSIMRWAKLYDLEKYNEIRLNSIDYFIEDTIYNINMTNSKKHISFCSDFNLAKVVHELFKDDYICASIRSNLWYEFKNNRWVEIDSGISLRLALSKHVRELYAKKLTQKARELSLYEVQNEDEDPDKKDEKSKIIDKLNIMIVRLKNIYERLGKTNDKKNIMSECKDLFYDSEFFKQLDNNPYLLCCKNGVLDFKENVFRRGLPEDYLSKSTNIEYHPVDHAKNFEIIREINDFMNKLFPIPELRQYMWEHLASTLIGISPNQTFNMYIGIGNNGKSVLVDLMTLVLGEYKGDVPLTLVTGGRSKIGGLSPEIVALKGLRYAVMQEPTKGDKMNEGIMKQITSGVDPLQGRTLHTEPICFIPQFKLVVCANEFLEIKSQDHGTWRRIRVVDFVTLFTDTPVNDDVDKPYQFLIDRNIKEKFKSWKEVFLAMLADIAFKTKGMVQDCKQVLASSNAYKIGQDSISQFMEERIIKDVGCDGLTKTNVSQEFKHWFCEENPGKPVPPGKEIFSYMEKKFGKQEKGKWKNIRFVTDVDFENEIVDEADPPHNEDYSDV